MLLPLTRPPCLSPGLLFLFFCLLTDLGFSSGPKSLKAGIAGHAFDHLGAIGDQAETAAASGANIIYASGLGALGYQGLPEPSEFETQKRATSVYLTAAKQKGIRLALGYVCATSIVGLDTFDKHWTPEFRQQFHHPPSHWL